MTPIYGNTTPGNQQSDFLKVLQAITNAPPSNLAPEDLQRAQQSAQSTALSMNVNQQPNVQAAKDNLTQQSGIPQLQGQYGDLAKLFPLYLHDSNLAGKYTNPNASANPFVDPNLAAAGAPQVQQPDASVFGTPQTTGQISGQAIAAPNPYLASADALVASGANAPQDPGTTTSMMAAPAKMATNFMDLINQAIGTEQGIVGNKTKEYSDKYSGIVSALSTLANVFGSELSSRRVSGGAGSVEMNNAIAQDAQGGMTLDQIMHKYGTSNKHDDILKLYNDYSSWGPASEDRDTLAKKYGISKSLLDTLGLPSAKDVAKTTKDHDTKVSKIKAFGDLVKVYEKNVKTLGPLGILTDPNAIKQYSSQKDLYLGGISKDLGISRSNTRFKELQKQMPGETVSIGVEGSFRGHLTTLLDLTGLTMYVNPATGETGVKDRSELNPTEQIVDPQTDNFNLVKGIIGGLR